MSSLVDAPRVSRYIDTMTELADLADAASTADPAVGLRAVRALQRLQERLEALHVANAREQGWSWQAIAEALGVSRQAVHQKYNRRR
jgi:DNA-directed RNA polymerase specialized sigma24 family protein